MILKYFIIHTNKEIVISIGYFKYFTKNIELKYLCLICEANYVFFMYFSINVQINYLPRSFIK